MKKTAIIIIIAGLLIGSYPLLQRVHTWYHQQKIITELEQFQKENHTENPSSGGHLEQQLFNIHHIKPPFQEPEQAQQSSDETISQNTISDGEYQTIGTIKIPAIDLELPLFKGAEDHHLNTGAALLKQGASIEEKGNSLITAHRGHSYGRLFNRLDELDSGDFIVIESIDHSYTYQVFAKKIVESEDNYILEELESSKTLTLITCHPLHHPDPPERLVIKASKSSD